MPEPVPMPARLRIIRTCVLVALGAVLLFSTLGLAAANEAAAGVPRRDDQKRFMWAMAGQESGWNYYARNTASGAFGKYQIMPSNWPVWAGIYLGDTRADQTPYNQERVATGKIRDLYQWLGSWKRVAYWWLTGRTNSNEKRWSSYARGYVRNIMRMRDRAPRNSAQMPPRTSSKSSRGDWRRSAYRQQLHLRAGGRTWPRDGSVRDGQVLKVLRSSATRTGVRWVQVVTADGRLGWLKQLRTVPAKRPAAGRRWRDVNERGDQLQRRDRRLVRPRPH